MNILEYRKEHAKSLTEMHRKLEVKRNVIRQFPAIGDEVSDLKKSKLIEAFDTLDAKLRQRLSRVKQSTARVSVIGLEKQGKSTFVNAWIGQQCLPSDTQRCTWASSTLINDSSYRATVRFLSREAFEKAVDELYRALNLSRSTLRFPLDAAAKDREEVAHLTGNPAFKDLEQLSKNYAVIAENLDRSPIEITEESIEAFNQRLFEWISLREKDGRENGKAYSVEHCDIHLPITKENLPFSVDDLPGIDAPGNRAEDMTWRNVENNADIIVLVKNAFNNASMNSSEIKIWDKAKQSDSAIKLTDRLFVALNQADADKSENGRNCHIEAFNEFHSKNVHDGRIFYVSSRAELYASTEDKSKLSFNDWTSELQEKAMQSIAEKRQQSNPTTGFPEFKNALYHFLSHDFQTLEERALRDIETDFSDQHAKFQELVSIFREVDNNERNASEEVTVRFNELWLPQDRENRNKKGLGNRIKAEMGNMLSDLNQSNEINTEFLNGIRKEIEASKVALLGKNSTTAFEEEYNPDATPIKDYVEMRVSYFKRMHGVAKHAIFNDLSIAISQNINEHIKGIWQRVLTTQTESAPSGLAAIGEREINEFLKQKRPEELFSCLDENETGKVPYGFAALLKSIAHADLEYLISINPQLESKRGEILYKAQIYKHGITSTQIGKTLRQAYDGEMTDSKSSSKALEKVIATLKNTSLLSSAADLLLPRPYAELSKFILSHALGQKKESEVEVAKPAAARAKGNSFISSLPSFPFSTSKRDKASATITTNLDQQSESLNPKLVVQEMQERIQLVYYVLESMLFDNDFGIIGYYRAIMEEFRLSVTNEIQNDGGVIKSLAFKYRETVFPNEPLFKHDTRKAERQRLISLADSL